MSDENEKRLSRDDLLRYFYESGTPREDFRIGTEHEKFGFYREQRTPLPFEGERGIEAILKAIIADETDREAHGVWAPILENDRVIGLSRGGASVTLEPGGQLELSGAPLETAHHICREVHHHLALLRRICLPLNVGFVGLGFHPSASYEELPSMPKSRYDIMRAYMPTRGTRGLDMMKRTCTVQANFDFVDESDMVQSFQAALRLSPFVTALFANSPFRDGVPSGKQSERAWVWLDTDPDRCGFPEPFFRPDFGFETYLEWVLGVPMYFVKRNENYLNYAGASFREFMDKGLDGHFPTLSDFEAHLTVVFPEVRLKRYLETRSADCGAWSAICALPALWKGLLYDVQSRDLAHALVQDATPDELRVLQHDVSHHGFKATFRGRSVLDICADLVDLSRAGLTRLAAQSSYVSEVRFLSVLEERIDAGQSFADVLLDKYHGKWGGDLSLLWEEIEFFNPSNSGSETTSTDAD